MRSFRSAIAAAGLLVASANAALAAPLEPATQKFIDGLAASGSPPIYTLTPNAARKVLRGAQAGPVREPAIDRQDRVLPIGPKGQTRVSIIRPHGAKGRLPVVMYFHGAGWVMGDLATHDRLVRDIAVGAHAAVVFVDYDHSPESRYPVAIEEDYAATRYVVAHAQALDVDATRLAVAGDSVGGNMATVVALLAKERHGPAIRVQLLYYPVTDANFDDGSYQAFANGPWLTRNAMKWFWDAYLPDAAQRRDPHVSPLQATPGQLAGLPDALVITDENDVLRDEGEAYARKLSEAGVRVTSTRYNGTIHDFVMLNALGGTPAARAATEQGSAFLKHALNTN